MDRNKSNYIEFQQIFSSSAFLHLNVMRRSWDFPYPLIFTEVTAVAFSISKPIIIVITSLISFLCHEKQLQYISQVCVCVCRVLSFVVTSDPCWLIWTIVKWTDRLRNVQTHIQEPLKYTQTTTRQPDWTPLPLAASHGVFTDTHTHDNTSEKKNNRR